MLKLNFLFGFVIVSALYFISYLFFLNGMGWLFSIISMLTAGIASSFTFLGGAENNRVVKNIIFFMVFFIILNFLYSMAIDDDRSYKFAIFWSIIQISQYLVFVSLTFGFRRAQKKMKK